MRSVGDGQFIDGNLGEGGLMRMVITAAVLATCAQPSYAIEFEELLDSYGNLETVAGTALITAKADNGWQTSMEGGPAVDAELSRPHMTMADAQGNLYIADKDAHAIRLVTTDGNIHTIAGTNDPGYNGDGTGVEVQLNAPNGLYTFPDGTTYILDLGNALIRRLSTDGELTTIVDDSSIGMSLGRGLWVSPDESTIYYASGTEVRKWTEEEGTTLYADGFVGLGNLHIDPYDSNLVVTDREGHGVYKVFEDGSRTLIAGNETTSGGGSGWPVLSTGLKEVRGVFFHPEGGYFLATHDGGQVWFVDDHDTIHLLIDGDDDGTHAGDGTPLGSPGRKISEPRAVTMAPNGDLIVTEHDGGYVRVARALREVGVWGDFNRNGTLDAGDIDRLSDEARGNSPSDRFDLNNDGLVDNDDRVVWVEELKNTYFGDANLDGEFDSSDLVQIFTAGEYEDGIPANSRWATGDWNGDRDVDSGDLVVAFTAGGYNGGPRPGAVGVPEPTSQILMLLAFSVLLCRHRRI